MPFSFRQDSIQSDHVDAAPLSQHALCFYKGSSALYLLLAFDGCCQLQPIIQINAVIAALNDAVGDHFQNAVT